METKKVNKKKSKYVEAREKLIPRALRNAKKICIGKKFNEACLAYNFVREMTKLTEEAGLIGEGNLALFDNKKIPPFCIH